MALRARLLLVLLAVLSAPLWAGCGSDPVREPESVEGVPNIILITLDTLRASHTTPYGSPRDTTPNLTAFARKSVQFERAYAAMPTTGPSHVTMLTGLYPQEHGVVQNGVPARDELVALPGLMRDSGRRTGAFVSVVHLAPDTVNLEGFEVWDAPERVRDGAETIEAAKKWVTRHREEPFFLWVHLFDPHSPYEVPDDLSAEIATALAPLEGLEVHQHASFLDAPMPADEARKLELLYDADIYYTDQLVGEFLDFLDESGLGSTSAIAITADHGEVLSEALDRWQYGFDHGELLLPGELRVPLWVRMPGGEGGTTEDAVVETRALYGTLLWAAKLPQAASMPKLPGFGADRDGPEAMAFVMRRTFRGEDLPEILEGSRVAVIRGDTLAVRIQRDGRSVELFDLTVNDRNVRVKESPPEAVQSYDTAIDEWLAGLSMGGDGDSPQIPADMQEHLRALGYAE
jgi:arylsulfatase A-like enzyme